MGVKPGMSLSVSLHRTTPSFSDVFRKSSGSAIFFLGELSTPSDINQVTVCSSGFIAPKKWSLPKQALLGEKKTGGLFRINMQLTSALLLQVKKSGGGGRTICFYTRNWWSPLLVNRNLNNRQQSFFSLSPLQCSISWQKAFFFSYMLQQGSGSTARELICGASAYFARAKMYSQLND